MGKLILLTSPRVCFCFAFQVTGFLFWLWLCANCLLSCSHQMFGVFLCVVYSITDLTRWVFDNIYVTKRVTHMITFKQFFNDNANHYSFVKYGTNFGRLTYVQMEQIEYEIGIDWDDYRQEHV